MSLDQVSKEKEVTLVTDPIKNDSELSTTSSTVERHETTTNHDQNSDGWEELMGKDLMLKSILLPDSDAAAVQPQDAVIVNFEGRYAPTNKSDDQILDDWINDNVRENNDNDESAAKMIDDYPIFQTANDWLVIIGEKDVLPALEMGIRFMQEGQTALIWSHSKYAYGLNGRKTSTYTLEPNSNVMYKVTLKQIIASSETLEDSKFQVQICESKKKIGNDIYNYELACDTTGYSKHRALALYKRASEMLEHMIIQNQKQQEQSSITENNHNPDQKDACPSQDENLQDKKQQYEQQQQQQQNDDDSFNHDYATELFLDCLNNITAVHMACKNYHAAKEAAVTLLTRDPNNIKGLIRAAKASMMDPGSTYDEVDAAVEAAVAEARKMMNPGNNNNQEKSKVLMGEIDKLRYDLKRRKQQYNQRRKQMSANIAKGLQSNNNKEITTTTMLKDVDNQGDNIVITEPKTAHQPGEKENERSSVEEEKEDMSTDGKTHEESVFSSSFSFNSLANQITEQWKQLPTSSKNIIAMYIIQLLSIFLIYWYFNIHQQPHYLTPRQQYSESESVGTVSSSLPPEDS